MLRAACPVWTETPPGAIIEHGADEENPVPLLHVVAKKMHPLSVRRMLLKVLSKAL
jgi:hypothetical protein